MSDRWTCAKCGSEWDQEWGHCPLCFLAKKTPLVKKSIIELQIDDGELMALRRKLTAEKQAIQGQLGEINTKLKTTLPNDIFHKLNNRRGQLVKMLSEKESEVGELNAKRAELQTVLEVRKREAGHFQPHDVAKLVAIRDKWHDFSMDKKNPKSARETAWKISQEIRELLKPTFATP
jgi:chromosome segregation ATPase